jgi:hypothetical protein
MQKQPNTILQKYITWKLVFIILIVLNILTLVYVFFGFGTITINKSDSDIVYVNENNVGNKDTLELRPGTYVIKILGSNSSNKAQEVTVLPFATKVVTSEPLTPLDIFTQATATPYAGGEYEELQSSYLENGWLVAKYEQTKNANVITVAYRFAFDKWNVIAYYPNSTSNEPLNAQLNRLPADVLAVFNEARKIQDED